MLDTFGHTWTFAAYLNGYAPSIVKTTASVLLSASGIPLSVSSLDLVSYYGNETIIPLTRENIDTLAECGPQCLIEGLTARLAYLEASRVNFARADKLKLGTIKSDVVRKRLVDEDITFLGVKVGSTKVEKDVLVQEEEDVQRHWNAYSPVGRSFYRQQLAGLECLEKQDRALVAYQQRVGKTPTMAALIEDGFNTGRWKSVVIAAPRRLLFTAWADELARYCQRRDSIIIDNDAQREMAITGKYDIYLTSFESLGKNWGVLRELLDGRETCLIADESVKVKDPRSKRTRALVATAWEVRYCYLLSGAPTARQHGDILPQAMALDPGLFGVDYTIAWDRYFEMYGAGDTRFRRNASSEFYAKLDHIMLRCTRGESEQFTGRDSITQNVRLKFDRVQAQVYKDIIISGIAEMSDEYGNSVEAAVATAMLQILRLREVCGGFLSYEVGPGEYERMRLPVNPKINWLRDWFEEHDGEQVVVFCEFNEEEAQIVDLLNELGIAFGGVSAPRRRGMSANDSFKADLDAFQAGTLQVFVGKHSSLGHGLTMNSADVAIFYSLGFNSDNYDQARQRTVGPGKVAVIYHLMMGGSIEETRVYKALSKRQDMKSEVTRDFKRRGYEDVFRELALEELLVADDSGYLGDMLEDEARRVTGYDGELTVEALSKFATGGGYEMFATVKASLGSCLSTKDAYRRCMKAFHPDVAIAKGHSRGTVMYSLFEQIAKAANAAMEKSLTVAQFVESLGGKAPDASYQKWYDYLLRKARARRAETKQHLAIGA